MASPPTTKNKGAENMGIADRYLRRELLGRGAYKSVYKAIDRRRGIEVAWNEIRLEGDVDVAKLSQEITILGQLQNERIMAFHDSWVDEEKMQLIFITELMASGALRSFVQEAKSVSISVIKSWCRQILQGLNYLHTRNPPIIHRDIKLDNIFFHGSKGQVKIGDLGLATILQKSRPKSVIGTPEFMAPEFYVETYNEKVDIWAFGMCVIEMVTLEYPYSECSNVASVYRAVSTGIKPQALARIKDARVLEFTCSCLEVDVVKRLSANELLKHPFLKEREGEDGQFVDLRNPEELREILDEIAHSKDGWDAYLERMLGPLKLATMQTSFGKKSATDKISKPTREKQYRGKSSRRRSRSNQSNRASSGENRASTSNGTSGSDESSNEGDTIESKSDRENDTRISNDTKSSSEDDESSVPQKQPLSLTEQHITLGDEHYSFNTSPTREVEAVPQKNADITPLIPTTTTTSTASQRQVPEHLAIIPEWAMEKQTTPHAELSIPEWAVPEMSSSPGARAFVESTLQGNTMAVTTSTSATTLTTKTTTEKTMTTTSDTLGKADTAVTKVPSFNIALSSPIPVKKSDQPRKNITSSQMHKKRMSADLSEDELIYDDDIILPCTPDDQVLNSFNGETNQPVLGLPAADKNKSRPPTMTSIVRGQKLEHDGDDELLDSLTPPCTPVLVTNQDKSPKQINIQAQAPKSQVPQQSQVHSQTRSLPSQILPSQLPQIPTPIPPQTPKLQLHQSLKSQILPSQLPQTPNLQHQPVRSSVPQSAPLPQQPQIPPQVLSQTPKPRLSPPQSLKTPATVSPQLPQVLNAQVPPQTSLPSAQLPSQSQAPMQHSHGMPAPQFFRPLEQLVHIPQVSHSHDRLQHQRQSVPTSHTNKSTSSKKVFESPAPKTRFSEPVEESKLTFGSISSDHQKIVLPSSSAKDPRTTIDLTLAIAVNSTNFKRTFSYKYDLLNDTPSTVAQGLARHLKLAPVHISKIEKYVEKLLTEKNVPLRNKPPMAVVSDSHATSQSGALPGKELPTLSGHQTHVVTQTSYQSPNFTTSHTVPVYRHHHPKQHPVQHQSVPAGFGNTHQNKSPPKVKNDSTPFDNITKNNATVSSPQLAQAQSRLLQNSELTTNQAKSVLLIRQSQEADEPPQVKSVQHLQRVRSFSNSSPSRTESSAENPTAAKVLKRTCSDGQISAGTRSRAGSQGDDGTKEDHNGTADGENHADTKMENEARDMDMRHLQQRMTLENEKLGMLARQRRERQELDEAHKQQVLRKLSGPTSTPHTNTAITSNVPQQYSQLG